MDLLLNETDTRSDLDPIIVGLPWEDGWEYGSGLDAVTGNRMFTALKKPEIVKATMRQSAYSGRMIYTDSQFSQEVDVNMSAKYNIGGVDVSGSAKYLEKISYSQMSLSIVVRYRIFYSDYDYALPESLELTDEAKGFINDPPAFRKRYGDYFVAGSRRVSEFVAIYNLFGKDSQKVREFEASFGAVSSILSVDGSIALREKAEEHGLTISCSVDCLGLTEPLPIIPTTPDQIIEALTWFNEHQEGVRQEVMLMHYSQLDKNYPMSVDVPPDVFVKLHALYRSLWSVRALYVALPPRYKDRFYDRVDDVITTVTSNQSVLPRDLDLRNQLISTVSDLRADLREVADRYDFWVTVKEAIPSEPKGSEGISAAKGQYTWMYGFATYPSSLAVVIDSTSEAFVRGSRAGWQQTTIEYKPDYGRKIVGWKVESRWKDNTNGQWWKVGGTILTADHGAVHVKSAHLRGCDWLVTYYTVPKADYDFD